MEEDSALRTSVKAGDLDIKGFDRGGAFSDYLVDDWGQAVEETRLDESAADERKIADAYLSAVESVSDMECVDSCVEGGVIHLFLSAPVPPLDQVSDYERDGNDVEDGMSWYDIAVEISSDGDSWWFGVSGDGGGEAFAGAEGDGVEDFKEAFAKMIDSLGIKATKRKPAHLLSRSWFETSYGSGRYEQKYSDASGVGREIGDAILFWPDGASYHNAQGHPAAFVLNKRHMPSRMRFCYSDRSGEYVGSDYYKKEPWLFR